jgi:O-antigen ligase
MFYLDVSRGTFWESPILGVGMGQYVYQLINIPSIQGWQFQPVHNIFLLILNELGIVGFFLFIWFVWEIIRNVPFTQKCSIRATMFHVEHCAGQAWNIFRNVNIYEIFKAIFLGFLFILLVDHYFWDIQQGQIMFWFVLAILVGCNLWIKDEGKLYPQA